jgi:hypothetical protein
MSVQRETNLYSATTNEGLKEDDGWEIEYYFNKQE